MAFDRQRLSRLADWMAFGVAVSLPWSTSATSILIALWLIAVLPTLTARLVWREVTSFAGGLPVLLWLVAALGMLWADVPWHDRLSGLGGYNRLLTIPILLAQFRRSDHGVLVLYGYLGSAVCLLMTSWALALISALSSYGNFYGVPVKNYIFQTDEFLICGFVLLGMGARTGAYRMWHMNWISVAIGILFLANLAFVFSSRTGLLVAPFLVAALGWRLSGAKGLVVACAVAVVVGPILWLTSPRLRDFTLQSIADMRTYFATNAVTSSGLHIEFLRRSVEIIEKAPLIGHGTGSIADQFRSTAAGELRQQERCFSESSQPDFCGCDPDWAFRCIRADRDVDGSFHALSRRGPGSLDWHSGDYRERSVVGGELSFVRFQSGLAIRFRRWRRRRHDIEAHPAGHHRRRCQLQEYGEPIACRAQKSRGATLLISRRRVTLRFERAFLDKSLRAPRVRRAQYLSGRREPPPR